MQQYNQNDGNGFRRADSFETLRRPHYFLRKMDANLSSALYLRVTEPFQQIRDDSGYPAQRYFAKYVVECKK